MISISGVKPAGIDNVYYVTAEGRDMLATKAMVPDPEALIFEGAAYRLWSPATSKLASMIVKGMDIPLKGNSHVLYLGAASGTTVSHVSDIVPDGLVYAVEFAPRPARDLIKAIESRENVIPIIADARRPDRYPPFIDHVDYIFQDVAQPDQASILLANADKYLIAGGSMAIAIKGRSISVSDDLGPVFARELEILSKKFLITGRMPMEPYHRDHLAVTGKYRAGP